MRHFLQNKWVIYGFVIAAMILIGAHSIQFYQRETFIQFSIFVLKIIIGINILGIWLCWMNINSAGAVDEIFFKKKKKDDDEH